MKKRIYGLFLSFMLCPAISVRAEWTNLSKNLGETDVQAVAIDPMDSKTLYAASQRRIYKSIDTGEHWKEVLGTSGTDDTIHFILVDTKDARRVFVASERGIQFSPDAGKNWNFFYRGIGDKAKGVYCLSLDGESSILWAGTAKGLVKIADQGHTAKIVEGIPFIHVFSILVLPGEPLEKIWVTSEKGIYKSEDAGAHWQRVFVEVGKAGENSEETSLSQFQIEELTASPVMSNLIPFSDQQALLAASSKGILEGAKNDDAWRELKNSNLPDRKINYIAGSPQTFYAATDRGVFRWEEQSKTFKDISEGLESKEVKMLAYHAGSGDLFAATRKGVFCFPNPDLKRSHPALTVLETEAKTLDAAGLLKRFETEPTIQQIQNAAVQYAEVHPDKIKAWREQAARKAWMPTVSFTTNTTKDRNVDVDRGGTNDPDKFIVGPSKKNFDWHMGVSWNLSDLIWNNDQTSIDSRSKLMVELRDDVLNEVTHLYYERRRQQMEILMNPAKELPLEVEQRLRLDELTAGIDALTGGYLSKHLEPMRIEGTHV